MNMLILGGDERSAYLALQAHAQGWNVEARYLEKLSVQLPQWTARDGWDAVVLPYPVSQKEGVLIAPLCGREVPMYEAVEEIGEHRITVGGAGAQLWMLNVKNPGADEGFVMENAAITAEGAVYCAMRDGTDGLMKRRCVILGCGRIARFLAQKLCLMGAQVTVAARSAKDRAYSLSSGWNAVSFEEEELCKALTHADYVFNTVPYPVLHEKELHILCDGAILYELASAPYGFSMEEAKKTGVRARLENGLPGKYAPAAAARALLHAIERFLKEAEHHA